MTRIMNIIKEIIKTCNIMSNHYVLSKKIKEQNNTENVNGF